MKTVLMSVFNLFKKEKDVLVQTWETRKNLIQLLQEEIVMAEMKTTLDGTEGGSDGRKGSLT